MRGDADGSAARPWPIYNIWHLQAIDGLSVAANGTMALNFPLFGGGVGDALTMHYRVMTEINALATRDWGRNLTGFNPIGDSGSPFIGALDGDGREARYLYVNADGGGLFGVVGGSVSRFGLSEMDIRGRDAGGLAATVTGLVSLVWGTGRVGVDESDGGGGLVAAVSGGDVRESWFVGEINGGGGIGGLVGRLSGGVGAQVGDSWAMARVSDVDGGNESGVGGLIGWSEGDAILPRQLVGESGAGGRWSGAAWSAGTRGASNAVGGDESYFDFSTSQFDASRFDDVLRGFDVTAFGVETMTTVSVMSWSESIWNFGDSEIEEDDKSADYPFLLGSEDLWPGRQAVAFADFQTRLLRGGEPFAAGERSFLAMGESMRLILDTNGIAPDAPTPAPTCELDSQGARVKTNYNGVTILLRTTAGGTMSLSPDCELIVGLQDWLFARIRLARDCRGGQFRGFARLRFRRFGRRGRRLLARRFGRRRPYQRLRLDAVLGQWKADRFVARRERLGGKAVADLQYPAIASDRWGGNHAERRGGRKFPVVWFDGTRALERPLPPDERH